jgi:hypothetical protein
MLMEIDGVVHMDLKQAAAITKYDENYLRRLAGKRKFYAQKRGHNWWTTAAAIYAYMDMKPQRKPRAAPGRRKPRKAVGNE